MCFKDEANYQHICLYTSWFLESIGNVSYYYSPYSLPDWTEILHKLYYNIVNILHIIIYNYMYIYMWSYSIRLL